MRKTIIKSAVERGDAHTGYQSGDPSPKRNPLKGTKPARVREVFPTDEVPHKWAHQSQPRARNPQGNLFFDGATIYSYRTSWPLARIYTKRNTAPLVLTNAARYSMTTSQHQNDVNRAASHLAQIEVPHVLASSKYPNEHRQNFDYLIAEAAKYLAQAQRAQMPYNVEYRCNNARALHDQARQYVQFFGLRWKVPAFPQLAWTNAMQRAERIANPDPASLDKRERARAKRKAANAARDEYLEAQRESVRAAKRARDFYRVGAARSSFRLGDAWSHDYEALRSSACMIRLDSEEIETSWGARIPAAAAPGVWSLVQRARKAGGYAGQQPGFTDTTGSVRHYSRVRIGDYPLDRIDADGTLHAGCHTIPYSELAMMARTLGLEVA
jgi:hypothetical protein